MADIEHDQELECSAAFGKEARSRLFNLDPSFAIANTSSVTVVPSLIHRQRVQLLEKVQREPDHWNRREVTRRLSEAIVPVAQFLGCDSSDLVFVESARAGVSAVLRSLIRGPEDVVLTTNHVYTGVDVAIRGSGATLHVVNIIPPLKSKQEVVELLREAVRTHPNIKLVVLDVISSATAIRMPVEEIVPILHEAGLRVLLDGAHVPGQLPINLKQLNPDYFVGKYL